MPVLSMILKRIVLLRLTGEPDRTQFDRLKDKVLITGPYARADAMIKGRICQIVRYPGEKGEIPESKRREFKTQQFIVQRKSSRNGRSSVVPPNVESPLK